MKMREAVADKKAQEVFYAAALSSDKACFKQLQPAM
jgi:hypothetical protein